MRLLLLTFISALIASCSAVTSSDTVYHLTKTTSLPDNGGWDFLSVDDNAGKVYISHNTEVDVVDADSGELLDRITGLNGVHGIAIASDLGRGFISNGKSNSVTIFDLKSLKVLSQVATGNKPDTIIYDKLTKRVFVFNADSGSTTIINAATGKLITDLKLEGQPEFAVSNNEGAIFVNLEDKNELLKIDAHKLKVLTRWPLAPGESPSSLALDLKNHRLFVGCHNKLLIVVNSDTGNIITTLPIGEGVDATAFDPETKLLISSNGEGTLTIAHQDTPDTYHVVDTIKIRKGSKTFALNAKTHRLFIPAAEFGPTPAPTVDKPKPHPMPIPGGFDVLIYDK